jgi:hypothetical protein
VWPTNPEATIRSLLPNEVPSRRRDLVLHEAFVVHVHHGWYTVYTRMVRARAWKSGAFCVVLDSLVPPHGWSALRLDLVPCEWTPESVWLKGRMVSGVRFNSN